MTVNARIVAAARCWIGTRFHHQGRLKKSTTHKGGVDCLGLMVGVADEIGLKLPDGRAFSCLDERDYPHYPDTDHLKRQLSCVMKVIPPGGMSAGDIVLLRINNNPQHLAIVSNLNNTLGMIHSYAPARAVVEHNLDAYWRECIDEVYRISEN